MTQPQLLHHIIATCPLKSTLNLFKKPSGSKVARKEITETFQKISKEKYLIPFNKWLERMDLCIKSQAHNFDI